MAGKNPTQEVKTRDPTCSAVESYFDQDGDLRDRRTSERRYVIAELGIAFDGDRGNPRFKAVALDVSDGGAMLFVEEHRELPSEFDLVLLHKRSARRVLLRWRKDDLAGVAWERRKADYRAAPRLRALGHAQLVFVQNGRRTKIHCVVRDVSCGGVKLGLSRNLYVPDVFELIIPRSAEAYRARSQWRRGDLMGVQFVDGEAEQAR